MVQLSVLQLLSWAGLDLYLYCQQSLQATQGFGGELGVWEREHEASGLSGGVSQTSAHYCVKLFTCTIQQRSLHGWAPFISEMLLYPRRLSFK